MNPETDDQFKIGVAQAIQQTQELIDADVAGLHFYVLNKSDATVQIMSAINRTSPNE